MKRRSVLRIVAEVIREPMFALLVVGGVVYLLLGDRVAADARVANFLALLCERYGRMGYSSKRFVLRMTRQEIANHLGLTMETVSRDFTTDCSRSNGGLMRLSEQTRPVLSWI